MRARGLVLFVLTVSLALQARGAAEPLVPGAHLVRGLFTPGSQPDGNSIILTAPDGLIVIDTGRHIEHTQAIVDYAKKVKQPIKAVINTHWHLDHIGGNTILRREYPEAQILASGALTGALKGFLANYRGQLVDIIPKTTDADQKKAYEAELAIIDAGPKLAPDQVISESGNRTLAGRELRIELQKHAVTAGDLWVYDASTGLLIAGDLVTLPAPFLDTACPQKWLETLDRLDKVDFQLMVPGHGPSLTHKQFSVYRRAFSDLLKCTSSDASKDDCINGWLGNVRTLIPTASTAFTRDMMGYYVDVLRRDPARVAPLCND